MCNSWIVLASDEVPLNEKCRRQGKERIKPEPSQCLAHNKACVSCLLPVLAQLTFSPCQKNVSAQWAKFKTEVRGCFSSEINHMMISLNTGLLQINSFFVINKSFWYVQTTSHAYGRWVLFKTIIKLIGFHC